MFVYMKIQQILHFDEDIYLPLDMTFIGKWNAEKDLPLRSLLITNEQQSKQIDNSYDAEEKKREKR
jgi:hypothetical protein